METSSRTPASKRRGRHRRRYWLLKSEPSTYSIADLEREGRTRWDGVRNYQARNLLRDELARGDLVLFHHSSADLVGPAGVARVASPGYPDPTQLDSQSPYFDPRATAAAPRWWTIDVEFVARFTAVVPLGAMRDHPALAGMMVIRPGARLSVQPVDAPHFRAVLRLAGISERGSDGL